MVLSALLSVSTYLSNAEYLLCPHQSPVAGKQLCDRLPSIITYSFCPSSWTANHFSTYGFPGRSDISSALGAFTVGVLSNL